MDKKRHTLVLLGRNEAQRRTRRCTGVKHTPSTIFLLGGARYIAADGLPLVFFVPGTDHFVYGVVP